MLERLLATEDDCRCDPRFDGDRLLVDGDDCPGDGRLAEAEACRATVIGALEERDVDSVCTRAAGFERALSEEEPIDRADRLDDLADRVAELEAAVQAVRGYVGEVQAINEDVERRADRALRKAQAIERHVGPATARPGTGERATTDDTADGADEEREPAAPAAQDDDRIFRWG